MSIINPKLRNRRACSSQRGANEDSYDWKDYVAIVIAMLQTVLLPIVIIAIIVVVISLIVSNV